MSRGLCCRKEMVKSGLKVLVDGCDISHDTLPVWPLRVHHLIYVLETRKTHKTVKEEEHQTVWVKYMITM